MVVDELIVLKRATKLRTSDAIKSASPTANRRNNHQKLAPIRSTASNALAAKCSDRTWRHAVNQISRSIAARPGSCHPSDPVRKLGGEARVARLDVSCQSRGDLLEHPAVAVRIAERGVRGVTLSLRIWAAD